MNMEACLYTILTILSERPPILKANTKNISFLDIVNTVPVQSQAGLPVCCKVETP
jgi:hypothetical protein